jgi:hypothetical protein
MKITSRVAAVAAGALIGVAAVAGAAGAATVPPKGSNATFFADGGGTASLQNTSIGKVIQLFSPNGGYGGFDAHALDGAKVGDIKALSYDYRVTTPNWNSLGGGSPRLEVDFSDGGSIALNPVTVLSSSWVHMDAMKGFVDTNGGAGGYGYQVPWKTAVADHPGATVVGAAVINDSGWLAPLTVQIGNLTLNSTVYTHTGTGL